MRNHISRSGGDSGGANESSGTGGSASRDSASGGSDLGDTLTLGAAGALLVGMLGLPVAEIRERRGE